MNREGTIEYLKSIIEILEQGCSNHGCSVNKRVGGQGTNAICRCGPFYVARDLEKLAKWLKVGDSHIWKE